MITNSAKRLTEAGKRVWIAMPEAIENKKTDFNDVLKDKGTNSIIQTIHLAKRYFTEETKQSTLPKSVEPEFNLAETLGSLLTLPVENQDAIAGKNQSNLFQKVAHNLQDSAVQKNIQQLVNENHSMQKQDVENKLALQRLEQENEQKTALIHAVAEQKNATKYSLSLPVKEDDILKPMAPELSSKFIAELGADS